MSDPLGILRIAAQMTGGGSCDNCGQPYAVHCAACLIPCCPGKCAARGEVTTEYAGMVEFIESFGCQDVPASGPPFIHTYTPPAPPGHQNNAP